MIQDEIVALYESGAKEFAPESRAVFEEFRRMLDDGEIRSAEPDASRPTGWKTNTWVKQGILVGFRCGVLSSMPGGFFDKDTYPLKDLTFDNSVRLVPGGSSVRSGAYLAPGVVCMPPSYVNVGAYVGAGTMIDSHVLVGSCAQIGANVHLSAAVQIGGVLEPIGANPVIVEDDVMIGGNCGVYEGVIVKRRAVLGTGVILNASTPLYDLVNETIHRATQDSPLVVPEGAVVVMGSRAISTEKGREWNLSLQTPIIVKIRDEKTDSRVQLEDFLR